MLVTEAITTDTSVLERDDSIDQALAKMDALGVHSLPVIDRMTQKLIGQLKRQTIDELSVEQKLTATIGDLHIPEPIYIFNNQHLFYAVQMMLRHELGVLPVVDEQMYFQGLIQKQQVLESLGKMLNLTEYGSVITIELNQHDFTMSEIVQLIETENGKILGITVEVPHEDHPFYEVSVKLNLKDVSSIASALRRYGYSIHTEAKSESKNIDLETRADEFLKFLDI